jgi:2-alkenal reductase
MRYRNSSSAMMLVIASLALAVLACGVALPEEDVSAQRTSVETEAVAAAPAQAVAIVPPPPTPTPLPDEWIDEADAEERLLANIYQRVNPSVVRIDIIGTIQGATALLGSGSGFIYDQEGHIITNNHVIADAERALVTLSEGTVAEAEILAGDTYSDLAVIRVNVSPEALVPAELGDSDAIQVGQRVIAIGNPFGLSSSMSVGIVSGIGRTLPSGVTSGIGGGFSNPLIIQTDAAINPGNSGGPLIDSHGHVIGVNVAISSETGVNSGVGFAIPINTVRRIIPQLIEDGEVGYAYLGITAEGFTLAQLATEFDLPTTEGVLIAVVMDDTAAAQAGLRGGDRQEIFLGQPVVLGGDIITAIDGAPMRSFDDLLSYLVMTTEPGQEVTLTVIRDGEPMDVPVMLGARPGY